ncbi:MAG: DUF2442 domain-containing protein [Deltaproteobacteria bacterium]|nr:DUF2442 domain-containing protein [Deltaproteobacteria bacterium]
MNPPRIKSVRPISGKRLLVTFVNGRQKIYDCHRILGIERFQLLRNEAFFKAVTVDSGGYGVSWNDEMDLSEYELWNNGVEIEPNAKETAMQQVERA